MGIYYVPKSASQTRRRGSAFRSGTSGRCIADDAKRIQLIQSKSAVSRWISCSHTGASENHVDRTGGPLCDHQPSSDSR